MEEFGEQVPETWEFHLGYFSGKQCTKYGLMCQDDLDLMSANKEAKANILLWCDARKSTVDQRGLENRKRIANANILEQINL